MFAAVLSPDIAWATAVSDRILNRCTPKGRYIEVEVFESPMKLLSHLDKKPVSTVIMSVDHADELNHAKSISEKGVKLILLTDSNEIAIKAYSVGPEYCTYKDPDDEDLDRISSIIFCNCKLE
ncbi:MAG: hypothetical protein IJ424_09215 [Oscillospiraceae bacterium]|nr:hypothetical protein [Oscillospiraceae bacterium]MBQ8624522.1 hypothetical protein [Oscillospiraceae bacterium]